MQSRTAVDRVMRAETAAASSQKWLERFRTAAAPNKMNELGLWLCDAILRRTYNGTYDPTTGFVRPPGLTTLIKKTRRRLITTLQALAFSNPTKTEICQLRREGWAQHLGAIALSFARDGDVTIVAAVVRAAAHLNLFGEWLDDAEQYLFEQQLPDGTFGLLAAELKKSKIVEPDPVIMRLTVEVLWAFAEVGARERRISGSGTTRAD
jgi:hypothetical protein